MAAGIVGMMLAFPIVMYMATVFVADMNEKASEWAEYMERLGPEDGSCVHMSLPQSERTLFCRTVPGKTVPPGCIRAADGWDWCPT